MKARIKKTLCLTLVLALFLIALGCSPSQPPDETAPSSPDNETPNQTSSVPEKVWKIALITPGNINDKGWNANGYAGLMSIAQNIPNVEVSHVEANTPSDIKDSFRDYASKGFDVVFGHGFQFNAPAQEIAAEFPDVKFITFGGDLFSENLAAVNAKSEEVGYIAGAVAASVSKSGIAGLVGGVDIPVFRDVFNEFTKGAQSVNPSFEVLTIFVGSNDDLNGGYDAALAHLQNGADVIYANGNAIGIGALQAANEKKIWCFGHSSDQSDLAPDTLIGSVVSKSSEIYLQVAKQVLEGTFQFNQAHYYGIPEGCAEFVFNTRIKDSLPEGVVDSIEKLTQDFKNGTLVAGGVS